MIGKNSLFCLRPLVLCFSCFSKKIILNLMNQPACNKMQQKSTWIKSINVLRKKLDYLFCIVSFIQCNVQDRQLYHCPQLMVSPISSVPSSWKYPTSFDFNISAKQHYAVFKQLHFPGGTTVTICPVSCWAAPKDDMKHLSYTDQQTVAKQHLRPWRGCLHSHHWRHSAVKSAHRNIHTQTYNQ